MLPLIALTQTAQLKVVKEWRFDVGKQGWAPNGDIVNSRTTDGALSFNTIGSGPILEYTSPLEFATSPWQAIEIRIKANHDGVGQIYWSNTTISKYGGFVPEKHTPYAVRGDGQFHTVRVFPFWQKEGRIIRLRVDPYAGTDFTIEFIRVVQLTVGSEGVLQQLYGMSVTPLKSGSQLSLTTNDGAALKSIAGANAEVNNVITVKMSTSTARRCVLLYATDDANGLGEHSFTTLPDGQLHLYNLDMSTSPGWAGHVLAVGLRPGERTGETCVVRSIELTDRPQGKPEILALNFGVEDALPRVGVPVMVTARVVNSGGETAHGLQASLTLPTGARLLKSEAASGDELRFAQEAIWRWTVVFSRPADKPLTLRVTSANGPQLIVRSPAKIIARLKVAKQGVMPAPKPVHGKIDVGVYYFPGWRSAGQWAPVTRYPERKPVLGWYREGEPAVADWQIKWAVEHGITFFAYDWYWQQGARSLEHGLDALFKAKYKGMLKFCLLWANHNAENSSSFEDLQKVTKFWLDNYFKRPEYYTIDGKPVVIIFTPYRFRSDMGSAEVKRSIEAMREECVAAGLKGLYLIACMGGSTDEAKAAATEGYDAVTAYNWPGLGMQGSEKWAPYDTALPAFVNQWTNVANTSPIPMMTPVCGGWDNRPWAGEAAMVRYGRNPVNFKKHLQDAKKFIEQNPQKTLPVALVEAWNELGEGSYIEPQAEYGFGYLDAIRDVFTSAPKAHQDITPADAGVVTPQVAIEPPGRSSWEFTKSLQGWESGMGITTPVITDGELTVRTIGNDPAFFSPPFQANAEDRSTAIISMRMTSEDNIPFTEDAQLFWSTSQASITEESSVRFSVQGDGQWHDYTVRLTDNKRWKGVITSLRLDPCNRSGVKVEIKGIKLVK